MDMDFEPLTEHPLLEAEVRLFPGVSIGRGRHSSHVVTGYDVTRENDDFLLAWSAQPTMGRTVHVGRRVESDKGAVLISRAQRGRSETRSPIRPLNVRVSRKLLMPLLPDTADSLMRSAPCDDPALRLLGAYLEILFSDGAPAGPGLDHAIALHICDLVALSLRATLDAPMFAATRGGSAARLAVVKGWILERLREPELSVSKTAAAQRVSPRYIQMLFEAEGTTFSAFLLAARLALARRQLINPQLASRLISAIAYDSGFGDLSYFNRAFRRAYGESPSDVRLWALRKAAE